MAVKKKSRRRHGKKAKKKVARAMHERKHGTLKSGLSKRRSKKP